MEPQQPMLFAADSHVRTSALPAYARGFLESDQGFGSNFSEFCVSFGRDGLLSRTFLACYPANEGETLPSSFAGWSNAGMASPGGSLTLSIEEWLSDGAVCSLSEVLETDVPQTYFLSPRACAGILRRAEKRAKVLPAALVAALEMVASSQTA